MLAAVVEHLVDGLQKDGVATQEGGLSAGPQERIDLARGRIDVHDRAAMIEHDHGIGNGIQSRTPAPGHFSSGTSLRPR